MLLGVVSAIMVVIMVMMIVLVMVMIIVVMASATYLSTTVVEASVRGMLMRPAGAPTTATASTVMMIAAAD